MIKRIHTVLAILVLFCTFGIQAKPLELSQIQVIPISDKANQRQYELYIKLPDNYQQESDKYYPVIYYTDALWHVELLSAAQSFIMEDTILVGISWQKDMDTMRVKEHGQHVSRYRDYSGQPSSNAEHQAKYQFGQADKHLAFIRNDVIAHVEKHYRTQPENRTYFGYSMGGEFGAYTLFTQPDLFTHYILGSPSVRGEIPFFTEIAKRAQTEHPRLNANVFVSYGTLEDKSGPHIEELVSLMTERNDSSLQVTKSVVEGNHGSAFPATGLQSINWLKSVLNAGSKS